MQPINQKFIRDALELENHTNFVRDAEGHHPKKKIIDFFLGKSFKFLCFYSLRGPKAPEGKTLCCGKDRNNFLNVR